MTYIIRNWVQNFETAKTEGYRHCQRITFTNNLNKIQRKRLLKHKDGPGHLAVWFSICQYHSAQSKPRNGHLTVNGKSDSEPLNGSDIADLIGMPEQLVTQALQRLSSPEIAWLEEIPVEIGVQSDQLATIRDYTPPSSLTQAPLHSELKLLDQTTFDLFWVEYPRKIGKQDCRKWFKRHKPDNLEQMLSTIKAFKLTEQWQDPKLVPHPLTWLHRGGWEDEITDGLPKEATYREIEQLLFDEKIHSDTEYVRTERKFPNGEPVWTRT